MLILGKYPQVQVILKITEQHKCTENASCCVKVGISVLDDFFQLCLGGTLSVSLMEQKHHYNGDFTTSTRRYGGSVSTWQCPLRKTTEKLQMQFNTVLLLRWQLPAIAKVHLGRAGREGEHQAKTLQLLSCKVMKIRISMLSTPSSIPFPTQFVNINGITIYLTNRV